ncbi:MAG: hypothetical protein ACI8QG_000162 [Flavobacteriales bacterium]|jgi:hypothetical protein
MINFPKDTESLLTVNSILRDKSFYINFGFKRFWLPKQGGY